MTPDITELRRLHALTTAKCRTGADLREQGNAYMRIRDALPALLDALEIALREREDKTQKAPPAS